MKMCVCFFRGGRTHVYMFVLFLWEKSIVFTKCLKCPCSKEGQTRPITPVHQAPHVHWPGVHSSLSAGPTMTLFSLSLRVSSLPGKSVPVSWLCSQLVPPLLVFRVSGVSLPSTRSPYSRENGFSIYHVMSGSLSGS